MSDFESTGESLVRMIQELEALRFYMGASSDDIDAHLNTAHKALEAAALACRNAAGPSRRAVRTDASFYG